MYQSNGLLAGVDVQALADKITRPPYAMLWRSLVARAQALRREAAQAYADGRYFSYGALGWHSVTPGVLENALVYRLARDVDALAYVQQCLGILAMITDDPHCGRELPGRRPPIHSHAEVALATDLCREGLTAEEWETILCLAREHFIDDHPSVDGYLRNYGAGGNVPLCHAECAGVVALVLGEVCGHRGWQDVVSLAVDGIRQYLRHGLDPSGYSYEGPGYGHGVLSHICRFAQLLKQRGLFDLFTEEPILATVNDAYRTLLFPDRQQIANLNDLGLAAVDSLPWLLLTSRYYGRPEDMGLWQAFQGPDHPCRPYGQRSGVTHVPTLVYTLLWWDAASPVVPFEQTSLPTATYAPGTETATFRSSWGTDALHVIVRGQGISHACQTHVQADCGHFTLFTHGEYLAIDTGRYNVDEDQHSVILVDGRCHLPTSPGWGQNARSGRLSHFQRHAMLDYIMADCAHVKDCIWADRHLLFVRVADDDGYLVILDNVNKDNDVHHYWWQLQVNPAAAVAITGDTSATIFGDQAALDLTFAIPDPSDYPQRPHTLALRTDEAWWGWPYGTDQDTSALERSGLDMTSVRRPRLLADVSGLNGLLLTVLSPRHRSAPPRRVRQLPASRVLQMEVTTDLGMDTIIWAPDHGYLDLPGVKGFSELALVRRGRAGQLVDVWTIDGSLLKVLDRVETGRGAGAW